MNTTITDTHPLMHFTAVWSDIAFAHDVAPHLSYGEVEALAGLFNALGEVAAADLWTNSQASADENEARQLRQQADDYAVPVDPMDDLQCDSCQ